MPLLVTTWHGTHLLETDQAEPRLVRREEAPRDPQGIARWLTTIRKGEVLPEERRIAADAKGPLRVLEKRLGALGQVVPTAVPEIPMDPQEDGYTPALLHEALLMLAVEEAHGALGGPDLLIVHEVRALDDVVRTMNLLAERLREWYAVHAPEVNARIKDHDELAKLVASTPDPLEAARQAGVEASGLGVHASQADAELVARFAQGYVDLMDLRADLENRLEGSVKQVAPALSHLLSPNVAARMIAQAGGLEKLAFMPAGTVQTLGAETALFRHLREGAAPPKHGILFQHEAVYLAPWWLRGRIARALSGKVAQAARLDVFGTDETDEGAGARLREEFDARVQEVRKRYPKPPERRRGGKRPHTGRQSQRQHPSGGGDRRGGGRR